MRAPVCVHHGKRNLIEFGDYVFCYFMDDQRQAQQVSPAMVSRCAPTPTG